MWKAEADSDVPSFDIRLTVDEGLVRLGSAREKCGPPLHTLVIRKGVGFEVEYISALDSLLPCIQIEVLFRRW